MSNLDIDKIEVLNTFFALVWTEVYQAFVPTDKVQGEEERLSQQLLEKSWPTKIHGADEACEGAEGPAGVSVSPFSVIFEGL